MAAPQVEAGMVESIHEVVKKGIASYATTPRERWVLEWPGQVRPDCADCEA